MLLPEYVSKFGSEMDELSKVVQRCPFSQIYLGLNSQNFINFIKFQFQFNLNQSKIIIKLKPLPHWAFASSEWGGSRPKSQSEEELKDLTIPKWGSTGRFPSCQSHRGAGIHLRHTYGEIAPCKAFYKDLQENHIKGTAMPPCPM